MINQRNNTDDKWLTYFFNFRNKQDRITTYKRTYMRREFICDVTDVAYGSSCQNDNPIVLRRSAGMDA